MQKETCWLLSHSSDLQTKTYIIYLVGGFPLTRAFTAVWRACVKGMVFLNAHSDLALSSFTLKLYFYSLQDFSLPNFWFPTGCQRLLLTAVSGRSICSRYFLCCSPGMWELYLWEQRFSQCLVQRGEGILLAGTWLYHAR